MSYIERPRFSCALGGAVQTITSLPGVVPIIHAASGCGGNLFSTQQAAGAYGAGFCGGLAMPSSNVSENEIIFGGEERLTEQITTTLEMIDAELFVVVTGCMTEIIGDDPRAVISRFKETAKPVLAVSTGGFKGNAYKGYDLVLQTLFTEYVSRAVNKDPHLVNIWGAVPGLDPFFRGDLEEIKHLLGLIGIKANTFFSYDETLANLQQAGAASGNIILSRVYGLEAAAGFREKHGTPFIVADIPIGAEATADFLYRIAEFLHIDKQVVDQAVLQEKKRYYAYIERVADTYLDSDLQNYVIIVTNANYAYPVTRFLTDDIGWLPELTVVTDDLADGRKETLRRAFKDFKSREAPKLVFETNASEIQSHFAAGRKLYSDERYPDIVSPLFVLGSTHELDLANNLGAKVLGISFPLIDRAVLAKGYAGFQGGLHLFEDLLNVLLARR
jgi:nitrogenase molybdenum-iron protein beta chain